MILCSELFISYTTWWHVLKGIATFVYWRKSDSDFFGLHEGRQKNSSKESVRTASSCWATCRCSARLLALAVWRRAFDAARSWTCLLDGKSLRVRPMRATCISSGWVSMSAQRKTLVLLNVCNFCSAEGKLVGCLSTESRLKKQNCIMKYIYIV